MLRELFGPSTLSAMLRGGLEETSATHRAIAGRVAGAVRTSSSTDFSAELADQTARAQAQADLERDMTELADTQLRYEADARLLHDAYARLRTAVRERA
jgi:flagellar basal body rod protein FlgB